ncbi:MICOS complex subunit MIC26-like [Scomber japonicus]|uniref:MICOS complex subunit MIC26-like n=1 Tax=Scomber japonicus TaxID=13676 RepID=UPI002305BA23|nr:MICOS complex subunit MIC26-like [Scomber japonicus]
MAPGIILKVTGGKMPAALSLLSVTVLADTGVGEKEESAPLNRDELSLYAAPPALKVRYAEHEAGQLEQSVATIRRAVEPYTTWCQSAYAKIKPKVQGVVQLGNDSYEYLKDPPKDFYPRAGVIAFTGVLGLVLARGSRIKKLIYPTGLLTVSTSLYYPEQAAAIAKSTGDSVYDSAVRSFASVEKMVKTGGKTEAKSTDSETKP